MKTTILKFIFAGISQNPHVGKRTMPAFFYMSIAIFAFSLYPLVMIFGAPMGTFTFLLLAFTIATIASLFGHFFYLNGKTKAQIALRDYFRQAELDDYIFIGLAGLTSVLTHLFFLFSIQIMSKTGATVIYESWPIFSMFLAPLIIRKDWNKTQLSDFFFGFLALIGIILISLSDQNISMQDLLVPSDIMGSFDLYTLSGSVLALMGGIMLALFVNFRAEFSNRLKKFSPDLDDTMLVNIAGEFICRSVALPFLIMAVLFIPEYGTFSIESLWAALIFGIGMMYIGNLCFTMALLKAHSPSIHILWYMTPALAVFWLVLFGLSDITTLIIVGTILIILSNISVAIKGPRKRQEPRIETSD